MANSINLEQYIFNCIARYHQALKQYREDALQEIRIAILTCETEKDALRTASRYCYRLLNQLGYYKESPEMDMVVYSDIKQSKEYNIPDDEGERILEQIQCLYSNNKNARGICRRFGKKYDKKQYEQIDSLLVSAFA